MKDAAGEPTVSSDSAELGGVKARFKLAGTHYYLAQTYDESEEERSHSEQNWKTMLEGLKRYVEGT